MYQHTRLTNNNFTFFQKFRNFDYILLFCILLLGFISLATMYSTDGGKILFHTKSHFTKMIIFTLMMLIISFINIKFWFSIGYLSYLVIVGLLVWTYFFGITSSGSQRWMNLYLFVLQPSELMKIGLYNFGMLAFGYLGETNIIPKLVGIPIGFVFFGLSFYEIWNKFAYKTEKTRNLYYFLIGVWALYGVAAMFPVIPKNIMYNILDIIAKNFYGLYIFYEIIKLKK